MAELSGVKWGSTVPGSAGGQVSWSFATFQGQFYNFDASISDPTYQALIRAAFNAWESVANIDFVEVSDNINVDIRLAWDGIDGGSGTVGEAYWEAFPTSSGFNTLSFAEIRFDTAEAWTTNPAYAGFDFVNFFTTAVHEIGHAIGLGHSFDPNAIMYFATNTTINLTPDDVGGAQAIYGAASGGGGGGLTGTAGNDTIVGTASNDVITGLGGNDFLVGAGGSDTVFGGDGNDQLLAGNGDTGNDALYGGNGNDTLGGGAGNDVLVGGAGGDVLFGGSGNDWLDVGIHDTFTADGASIINQAWAGTGADRVDGDNTTDVLGGGSGNDTLTGYGANDILFGGQNSTTDASNKDLLYGGDGNDRLYGSTDTDLLDGGTGADVLFGGDSADTLTGGDGDDDLWGGTGNDLLTGGAGSDLFGFIAGSGTDRITDFAVGLDVLHLASTTTDFTSAASVAAAASDTSAGLQIALGGGAILVLANVTVADIVNMDFVF